MRRRTAIALAGAGLALPTGYVVWDRSSGPRLPDGIEIGTLHEVEDLLTTDESLGRPSSGYQREYHTRFVDERAARTALVDSESVTTFLDATDFGESYLVVVQNLMQRQMRLTVAAIERTDGGIRLDVDIEPTSSSVDDGLTVHSLLVRITDETDDAPHEVTVDVSGYR